MTIVRRTRPTVFPDRITIRVRAETKQAIARMGHVSRRRFTLFCREQIELALANWQKMHPPKP